MTPKTSLKSLKSTHRKSGGKKIGLGSNYFWMIAIVFFLIVIVVLTTSNKNLIDKIRGGSSMETVKIEEAGVKLKDFVDQTYARSIKSMEVLSSKEESGMYAFEVSVTSIDDQTSTSTIYTTKDGKFFLPNTININETLDQIKGQEVAAGGEQAAAQPTNIPKTDKPVVEMFTMSYCPFGNQAEDAMSPVARLLGDKVDIIPRYVIYANYRGGGPDYCIDEESKYCSMHGIEELNQNIRELCIYKYKPAQFWDYIDAVNKECTLNNIETCWDGPAKKLGINTDDIASCLEDEAIGMLKEEVAAGEKYGVSGSPTIVINGTRYNGGRSPEDYKLGVCGAFNAQPGECSTVLGQAAPAAPAGGCE
jgi:hypothetical protein